MTILEKKGEVWRVSDKYYLRMLFSAVRVKKVKKKNSTSEWRKEEMRELIRGKMKREAYCHLLQSGSEANREDYRKVKLTLKIDTRQHKRKEDEKGGKKVGKFLMKIRNCFG